MKKVTKMLLLLVLVVSMLVVPAVATNGAVKATLHYQNIKILLDGEEVKPVDVNGDSTEPFIIDGTTYLPVRAVAEAVGCDVEWDGETNAVSISSEKQDAAEVITPDPNCDFKVVTLGTGAPPPEMERFGPAVYVEVNGQKLLFDAGRGVMQRMYQMGISANDLDMVFITHLHSDHTVGLPDLYLLGMMKGPFGQRFRPFEITGVEGTKDMMEHIKQAYAGDIRVRIDDNEMKEEWTQINVTELSEDGVVYEKDGVTVTAIENFHGEAITPSYGFRIDYDGRSVVISGDTKYSENIVENSKNVDLLIHSVGMANEKLMAQDTPAGATARNVQAHHTSPQEAAQIFNETTPKLAVFNHMVLFSVTQEQIAERTREYGYTGPLEIARDLMTFEIGETIRVVPYQA